MAATGPWIASFSPGLDPRGGGTAPGRTLSGMTGGFNDRGKHPLRRAAPPPHRQPIAARTRQDDDRPGARPLPVTFLEARGQRGRIRPQQERDLPQQRNEQGPDHIGSNSAANNRGCSLCVTKHLTGRFFFCSMLAQHFSLIFRRSIRFAGISLRLRPPLGHPHQIGIIFAVYGRQIHEPLHRYKGARIIPSVQFHMAINKGNTAFGNMSCRGY